MQKTQFDIMNCTTDVKNVGVVSCGFDPSNIEGNLLLKKGTVITPTQALQYEATFSGLLANDSPSLRAHLIQRFEGCEDKKTEGVYTESPYGIRRKVRNGKYGWRWEYKDGGLGLHTKLATFDNKQNLYDVLLVDTVNNGFWGCASGNDLKGFKLALIDVPNFDLNTGSETSKYYWEIMLDDEKEINLRPRFLKLPDNVNVLDVFTSLYDTEMTVATAMDATGLVSLRFTAGNGAVNLTDDYSGTLDEPTLYTASVSDTGAGLDIDSVAFNAATGNIDVQLDATDPDFPASGANIKIAFGAVSDIETAGMPGYSEASIITPLG